MPRKSSTMSVCSFTHVWHLNFLSSFSLPLIPLHLLCYQHLLNWYRMELMPIPFMQTTQENLPSIVTFAVSLLPIIIFGCSTLVRQHPMKSLCTCPSVDLLLRPSLSFLKIRSLVFSTVHDGSWPWYLVTDEARFLKKKICSPNLGPKGQNQASH